MRATSPAISAKVSYTRIGTHSTLRSATPGLVQTELSDNEDWRPTSILRARAVVWRLHQSKLKFVEPYSGVRVIFLWSKGSRSDPEVGEHCLTLYAPPIWLSQFLHVSTCVSLKILYTYARRQVSSGATCAQFASLTTIGP